VFTVGGVVGEPACLDEPLGTTVWDVRQADSPPRRRATKRAPLAGRIVEWGPVEVEVKSNLLAVGAVLN
jgi:hypothetical protein